MQTTPPVSVELPELTPAAARVATAAVAVIAERGFDELSVRTVAARLGMSGGAVQHHFPTRADLLRAAMIVVGRAMIGRLPTSEPSGLAGPPRDVLLAALRETLPLDEARRAEGAVWVALSAAGATHPELRDLHRTYLAMFVDGLTALIAMARSDVGATGSARVRARTVAAVVDGLTLQGITGNLTPRAMTTVLARAVDDALR